MVKLKCKIPLDVELKNLPKVLHEVEDWYDYHNFSEFKFRDRLEDLTLNEVKEDAESYFDDLTSRLNKYYCKKVR